MSSTPSEHGAPWAPWAIRRPRPLHTTPERRLSSSEARRGLRGPPPRAAKLRKFPRLVHPQVASRLSELNKSIESSLSPVPEMCMVDAGTIERRRKLERRLDDLARARPE